MTISAKTMEEMESKSPGETLRWAHETFPNIALSASMQQGGIVLIHMAKKDRLPLKVFTIDTHRLPEETYAMIDRIRREYEIEIQVYSPSGKRFEEFVTKSGYYSFMASVEERRECCYVNKTEPFERALSGLDAWISGLRKGQSALRSDVRVVQVDSLHNDIIKISPLANWTDDDVWAYTRDHNLPYHPLYDKGFSSIGCEPCTRPTKSGQDQRAGRWWWEQGKKECGLHYQI